MRTHESHTSCSLKQGQAMENWTRVKHLDEVSNVIFLIHCITILE